MKKSALSVVAVATLAGSLTVASPASASPSPLGRPADVTSGLVTPLSFDVDRSGTAYVAQNFAGLLTAVAPNGQRSDIVSLPGFEIGAVSVRDDTVYFAKDDQANGVGVMMAFRPGKDAAPRQIGDIGAFEASSNPDGGATYGFVGIDDACSAAIPPGFPGEYTGVVDTHPYGSAADASGVYVADAAANAVFKVGYDGAVSTVAVLPPQKPLTLTAEQAVAQGLPACVAAYPFVAEPVPTDIEIGPRGALYVTTLPGGPEDPAFGPRGSVYKIDQRTGRVTLATTGLGGATGLAVSPLLGVIFVAELFGGPAGTGQVSVILPGVTKPIYSVPVAGPGAIELRNGKVYVTRDVLPGPDAPPDGKLTVVPLLRAFG